ncbi:MAG: glycine cleavage system aminomethyltransferase GcvT [Nitrospirota bacterium]
MKQTALNSVHSQAAAKMTEFQGWQLPAHFSDPTDEYHAVRGASGLFDVGFLGRIEVTGAGSEALLQSIFTRNISKMSEGTALYGLLCNESGFILDTVLVFKLTPEGLGKRFLITTNAVSTDMVLAWLKKNAPGNAVISDLTATVSQFALQGPHAESVLEALSGAHFKKIKQKHLKTITLVDVPVMVTRTSFTGERGYELFVPADKAVVLWDALLKAGTSSGLLPCGMTSRDILRLEAGYVQYGIDIDETRTPVESGLMHVVDLHTSFLGKDAIMKRTGEPIPSKLVGFELYDKGIPKLGGTIFSENREIGSTTSGNHSPHIRKDIGLGYVLTRYAQPGQEIEIEVKDKEIAAKIIELPFYKRK